MARGKTKKQVQAELNLDAPPDDELMGLLAELAQLGEGPVPSGPDAVRLAQEYSPSQISQELETALVAESVGVLIATARAEARLSLGKVGKQLGVSRARVGQLEGSENIEIATLERIARTLGYRVEIHLEPLHPKRGNRRPLRLTLDSPPRAVAQPLVIDTSSKASSQKAQADSSPSGISVPLEWYIAHVAGVQHNSKQYIYFTEGLALKEAKLESYGVISAQLGEIRRKVLPRKGGPDVLPTTVVA